MAETQAKSGTTGTSIDPNALTEDGSESSVDNSAVGRASVPSDSPTTAADGADSAGEGDSETKVTDAPEPERDQADPPGFAAGGHAGGGSGPDSGGTAEADRTIGVTPTVGKSPTPGPMPPLGPSAPGGPPRSGGGPAPRRTPPFIGRGSATATVPTRSKAPDRITGTASPATAPADGVPNTGAARVADAVRSARATVSGAASRGPRRARLFVKRVDPWSVMKFSFAVSFVLFFVLVVATSVLYLTLDQMSVFTSVNKALAQIFGAKDNIKVTATAVIGAAGAIGLVMVVLLTAMLTLAAFIYNVCADLVGGIEVTLSEKE
jgi:hypothetical protein